MKKPKINLIIDSGAYGAWSQGKVLDVKRYLEFLQENRPVYSVAVNLDVIPDNPQDVERAAAKSWENYSHMKDCGLPIMPVFHMGERVEWLHKMLDSGAPYIGLGGAARAPGPVRRAWLDKVWPLLVNKQGKPLVKVHGFAITALPLMSRYPWFSVDSISYIRAGGSGLVFLPRVHYATDKRGTDFTKTAIQWDQSPTQIITSTRSREKTSGMRMSRLGPNTMMSLQNWCKTIGMTSTDLEERVGRIRANALFYHGFAQNTHVPKLEGIHTGLFGGPKWREERQPVEIKKLNLHLTVDATKSVFTALHNTGANNRLISYLEFRNNPPIDLEKYVNDEWVSLSPRRTK